MLPTRVPSVDSFLFCFSAFFPLLIEWFFEFYNALQLSKVSHPWFHMCSVAQSWPVLCDTMDCILPGSSVRGISQARYWSELPFPPPGDLPNLGIEPASPALWADSLPLSHGESPMISCNPVTTPFSSTPVLPPASLSSLVMASLFFISVDLLPFCFIHSFVIFFRFHM